jgi:hypothetical protein
VEGDRRGARRDVRDGASLGPPFIAQLACRARSAPRRGRRVVSSLAVVAPSGLRVEGVALDDVIVLVRALG